MPASTSTASAICGTHFGETKAVASMEVSPESESLPNTDTDDERYAISQKIPADVHGKHSPPPHRRPGAETEREWDSCIAPAYV